LLSDNSCLDLVLKIQKGEGKLIFNALSMDLKRSHSFISEKIDQAFEDSTLINKTPIHVAFATRGEYESFKVLNMY
jgi:hypothetical protein